MEVPHESKGGQVHHLVSVAVSVRGVALAALSRARQSTRERRWVVVRHGRVAVGASHR